MGATRLPVAFVIMPFSAGFERIFTDLIRPALPGYEVIRADSRLHQQNILRSVVEGIHAADLVIADVTGTNANVMYELGAAHALRKPAVMMSQSIDGLPFDLRSYLVQAYDSDGPQAQAFLTRLREIGEKHAAGLVQFGNPFTDFAPTEESVRETLPPSAPPVLIDEGYGYLDYSADMEEFGEQVLSQFTRINELSVKLTADVRALAPAINRARSAGSAKLERQMMNDLVPMMREYADRMIDEILPAFHEGWERVGFAMHWMVSQKPADADASKIAELCASGKGLREVLQKVVANIFEVRKVVAAGRGRTGALDKGITAMERAFNAMVSEVMIADAVLKAVHARVGCDELPSD